MVLYGKINSIPFIPVYIQFVIFMYVVDRTDRSYYEFSCKMRKRFLVYSRNFFLKNLEMALSQPSLAIHCLGKQLADTVVRECLNYAHPSRFNRFYRSPMRLEFHKFITSLGDQSRLHTQQPEQSYLSIPVPFSRASWSSFKVPSSAPSSPL